MDEERFLGRIEQMVRSVLAESEARTGLKLEQPEARLAGKLARLEARLDSLESQLHEVSARVDRIKESVDSPEGTDVRKGLAYLQDKWVVHDREIWQLKRKA